MQTYLRRNKVLSLPHTAFTLIEIILVIVILGVVASAIVAVTPGTFARQRVAQSLVSLDTHFRLAIAALPHGTELSLHADGWNARLPTPSAVVNTHLPGSVFRLGNGITLRWQTIDGRDLNHWIVAPDGEDVLVHVVFPHGVIGKWRRLGLSGQWREEE